MTEIEIEYCVPCGLRGQAQEVQEAILSEHEEELDRVSLVTGHGGVLIVRVDGEQVFHNQEDDYDVQQIVSDVAAKLE